MSSDVAAGVLLLELVAGWSIVAFIVLTQADRLLGPTLSVVAAGVCFVVVAAGLWAWSDLTAQLRRRS